MKPALSPGRGAPNGDKNIILPASNFLDILCNYNSGSNRSADLVKSDLKLYFYKIKYLT